MVYVLGTCKVYDKHVVIVQSSKYCLIRKFTIVFTGNKSKIDINYWQTKYLNAYICTPESHELIILR